MSIHKAKPDCLIRSMIISLVRWIW